MQKLAGKIAIITGGSSGIGLETAKRFVQEGAYVFIAARRADEFERTKATIGENVTCVATDVTRMDELDKLFAAIKIEKGHLDIVFANAGRGEFVPLHQITEEHADAIFDLNLKAPLFTVQRALPLLRDGASIILTSSIAAVKGFPGLTVYAATKAGLRAYARVWANELKNRRIRTNLLSPGPVNTPPLASKPNEAIKSIIGTIPLGRIGKAEELAAAALFLASDESSFINGTELFADGGAAQV
ncbi:MAG TPA: SDR family oxidoreductase [Candidatus Angelobacter sp.]|nr:SDR family oxidoreductase [Candidatus Angelobacter sp.]